MEQVKVVQRQCSLLAMFRSRRREQEGFREPVSMSAGVKRTRWPILRITLPPLLLALIFSFGLVSYSLLSHSISPAYKQQIGWQAWDMVKYERHEQASFGGLVGNSTNEFAETLPLDKWDPVLRHTTGLTALTVKPCYFPPSLFPEFCMPESTPEEDKNLGKWVRVDRDLNLRTGIWYLHIYYRRTRRYDVPLIDDIQIHPNPPPVDFNIDGWTKASGDLHSGTWPTQPELRIWYHTREPNSPGGHLRDRPEIITEIDVLYGEGVPFFGFDRVQGDVIMVTEGTRWEQVSLTCRRQPIIAPPAPQPRFNADGKFKIMQIADLHFSVGNGVCRDTLKVPCVGDTDTLALMGEALDAEKPDLVIFSGDQLNGQKTSYDSRSVLAKFAAPVIDRKIPWAAIFGNHDSEILEDRGAQMRWLQTLPYSLAEPGPASVDGVGNYFIKLVSSDASHMHLFTIYLLDSHGSKTRAVPWAKSDYDYIKESQIQWFRNVSDSIKPIERPFVPDGSDDLGDIWRKRRLPRQDARTLGKPNALMFFHIPLPEAYQDADLDGVTPMDVGSQLDGAGAASHNGGFFDVLKGAAEGEGDRPEVKILAHGHCHVTDRCRRVGGIWQCFGGGGSYSGYGLEGFDRRFRVYELSDWGEKVKTWKWLESGDVIDEQVLVA